VLEYACFDYIVPFLEVPEAAKIGTTKTKLTDEFMCPRGPQIHRLAKEPMGPVATWPRPSRHVNPMICSSVTWDQ
jgi:hypothetical protein